MPLFDLKCKKCGTIQTDVVIVISGKVEDLACTNPECMETGAMEKMAHNVSMQFKGRGWTQKKAMMTPRESVESSLKWPK